jgi:predicted membrane protein
MLFVLSILACLSFGFSLRRRFLLSMIVAPLMISIVMALIADLDTPSRGFIRVDLDSIHQIQSDLHNEAPK